MDLLENGAIGKTGPQGLKTLAKKGNVEVTHFHIKPRSEPSLVFVQITLERCAPTLYFKNGDIGIETTIATMKPLLAWNISAMFAHFYAALFLIKACFYETSNDFHLK